MFSHPFMKWSFLPYSNLKASSSYHLSLLISAIRSACHGAMAWKMPLSNPSTRPVSSRIRLRLSDLFYCAVCVTFGKDLIIYDICAFGIFTHGISDQRMIFLRQMIDRPFSAFFFRQNEPLFFICKLPLPDSMWDTWDRALSPLLHLQRRNKSFHVRLFKIMAAWIILHNDLPAGKLCSVVLSLQNQTFGENHIPSFSRIGSGPNRS